MKAIWHKIIRACFLLLLMAGAEAARAQIYPVQSYTQLLLPYSPFVPDYYSDTQHKLRLTL
ncbi:MAG: hypothetical protein LBL81_03060, partial [Tannerella sp.]|nr:hypothetical protein [Tannerella sp.]